MIEYFGTSKSNFADLTMYSCGKEKCAPNHSYGPAVRDHYLIHYILDGKGTFQVNKTTYHLEKGNGFLICPNVITYYEADQHTPWTYAWVGFHGLKAESYLKQANLSYDNPIFTYTTDDFIANCFFKMLESQKLIKGGEFRFLGWLYMFFSQLIECCEYSTSFPSQKRNRKELYVEQAVKFIERNYSRKIHIADLAHHIGLDRSYVYSIFKEILHLSPQEFLIHFRMNKACELMKNFDLTIGDISRSVGYEDPLLFSKIFKKINDVSPQKYRNNHFTKN